MLSSDMDCPEHNFQDMIGRYFRNFAGHFFECGHEFWKCFVDSMCAVFGCDKELILSGIDAFAYGLLYDILVPTYSDEDTHFAFSESIAAFVESENMPRMERPPVAAELYTDATDVVRTRLGIDEGQFICDLPGFMLHTDELDVTNGIPRSCLAVTNQDVLVDMAGTPFQFAHLISRSFHFNTIVKLYRLGEEPRAGLFATRLKGPLFEERGKRGMAIVADGRLILPFDGELPYPAGKSEWKEKKGKRAQPKPQTPPVPKEKTILKKKQPKKIIGDVGITLSLLVGFTDDAVPPLPFRLMTEKEIDERNKKAAGKARARNHRMRDWFS
jgi:hypothetical protein